MVSLRTNLRGLRLAATVAAWLLVLLGMGLATVALVGRSLHGASLEQSVAAPELKQYVASIRQGAPFELARANRIIYLATTHSDDRRIALTENWLQWSLARLYPPLARTQHAERLLAGSLANCSERSQILKSLAEEAGYACRFVGLSGHVVLEVETANGWQVADPDYGVVYPLGIDLLEQPEAEGLIRSTLAASNYPPPTIDYYLALMQSAEDNVVLPVGSALSPRLAVVETWCDRLALPLPVGMVLCGMALLVARSRQRRPECVSQAACGTEPRRQ